MVVETSVIPTALKEFCEDQRIVKIFSLSIKN